jgi:hypothetical protein
VDLCVGHQFSIPPCLAGPVSASAERRRASAARSARDKEAYAGRSIGPEASPIFAAPVHGTFLPVQCGSGVVRRCADSDARSVEHEEGR